jgi:RNA polymerase sigma-70 factor (ECF subfamily)
MTAIAFLIGSDRENVESSSHLRRPGRLRYDGRRRRDCEPVDERDWMAERFEANRDHLRAVAYRMLGSTSEADDAVQEAWIRLNRSASDDVENLQAWLTTVVARVCLDMLRSRKARREEPLGPHVPEPIVSREDAADPEHEALLADSVGLALQVVLETLGPAERLAFVLHDMFAVPFEEIAPIVGRSPAAARQLASRGRRRVRGAAPAPDVDLARQRQVVDAFLAAARGGDFEALVDLLAPDVVFRLDRGAMRAGGSREVRGAATVAEQVLSNAPRFAGLARPARVNGAAGVVVASRGRPIAVVGFTVAGGRIAEIDLLADPDRLRALDLSAFEDGPPAA